ncbi:MAG: hypothetical protein ABF645_12645, partial [Lentilactobacillus hilgardii]
DDRSSLLAQQNLDTQERFHSWLKQQLSSFWHLIKLFSMILTRLLALFNPKALSILRLKNCHYV